jgi:DNA invertase Pin-like site-specific DNA recombinase
MTNAIILTRTSTDEQATSHVAQHNACTAYALRKGYQVVASYEEEVSGAAPLSDRPTLQAAIQALRPDMVLIVAVLDRLTREPRVYDDIDDACISRIADIETADGNDNSRTPDAEMMRTIKLAFARRERLMIGQRTKAALAVLKAQGVRLGRPPGSGNQIGPRKLRADKGIKRGPQKNKSNSKELRIAS